MPIVLEMIHKILEIEIQNNYANRAIIGGLDGFLPTLRPKLAQENIAHELSSEIEGFFLNYTNSSSEQRAEMVRNLLCIIKPSTIGNNTSKNTQFPHKKSISAFGIDRSPKPFGTPAPVKTIPNRSAHNLQEPLTKLGQIGSTRADDFETLGVKTINDLFYFYPRRHDDYSKFKPINRLEYGDSLTIIAAVQSTLITKLRNRDLSRVEVVVSDGTGFLRLSFFRGSKYAQNFANQFTHGKQLVISGKVEMYLGRKQMNNPDYEELDKSHLSTNGIIPVYPLTSGLTQKIVRTAVNGAINTYSDLLVDFLSPNILTKAGLVDLPTALKHIHYPSDIDSLSSAQKRLAFDEIFLLQLGVLQQKRNWVSQTAATFCVDEQQFQKIISSLPFELTNAQKETVEEVKKDLASGSPMNRLLQGDVGSGKTVVAALAIAIIIQGGGQAVIMAPTSILAEQHFRSMVGFLTKTPEKQSPLAENEIKLLTGDTNANDREVIKKGLLNGTIKLVIGTHALIEDPILFQNLQLAVIDEQHRFGVAQRAALRKKGSNPHLLVMTATPIPRSLALTLYGDLELSIMDEMPIGRKPVITYVLSPLERERAYQLVRSTIEKGNQAFIVYPLIEQGENDEVKSAVEDHRKLQEDVFPDLKLGLLHGRMSPDDKESVMRAFREKEFHILVSTTVIEVGVDIPNALLMVIEGANRFGLAQLHQLRGRVGRGDIQASCLLIPESEDAIENERLRVMTETNDGFILAEKDLQQRGPGDFIGYRQSGFADLRMARITDIRLIEKARNVAEELFSEDPMLLKPENALLLGKVSEFWSAKNSDPS